MTNEQVFKQPRQIQRQDINAGERLKQKREELNITQKVLASRVGVTFQQIQKYEKGLNRISSSRLSEFCEILGVQPAYFFPELNIKEHVESVEDNTLRELLAEYNLLNQKDRELVLSVARRVRLSANSRVGG